MTYLGPDARDYVDALNKLEHDISEKRQQHRSPIIDGLTETLVSECDNDPRYTLSLVLDSLNHAQLERVARVVPCMHARYCEAHHPKKKEHNPDA